MLLVVVLTMIVALTVGLSVAARTITNLKISKQNEESQRAFQAAEAGVEQSLQSSQGTSSLQFSNNAKYTTNATISQGASFLLNGGDKVDQDTGIDVWLSTYPDFSNPVSGNITFYWTTSNQTSCDTSGGASVVPALEIVVLSGSKISPTLTKYFYDACANRRANNFASTPGSGGALDGETFASAVTITVSNGIIVRVVPIYNSGKMGVAGAGGLVLPSQGTVVESVGTSGETVRKVKYFSSHPQIPLEIFPYSIISQ